MPSKSKALFPTQHPPAAAESFRLAVDLTKDAAMQSKTLNNLYKVAVKQIQQDRPQGVSSREEMIQALQTMMWMENYDRLAANAPGG